MAADDPRTVNANVSGEWPPTSADMEVALLQAFSQHLVAQRDHVVRRAYATIVERHPYAQGRVHQRPFAALDELNLDEASRDKIVDVVAVFVDEAMEHFLALLGSVTNTVGDYHTVTYSLNGQIKEYEAPAASRYSLPVLRAAWREDLERMIGGERSHPDDVETDDESPDEARFPITPIGKGEPLWFDYRKWLNKYCTFRRSARPSR